MNTWGSDVGFQLLKLHGFLERICARWCIQSYFIMYLSMFEYETNIHAVQFDMNTCVAPCTCRCINDCLIRIYVKKTRLLKLFRWLMMIIERHQLQIIKTFRNIPSVNCVNKQLSGGIPWRSISRLWPKLRGRSTTFSRAWPGYGLPSAKKPCPKTLISAIESKIQTKDG